MQRKPPDFWPSKAITLYTKKSIPLAGNISHCKIRHWILYTSHECTHIVMQFGIDFVTSDKIQCLSVNMMLI